MLTFKVTIIYREEDTRDDITHALESVGRFATDYRRANKLVNQLAGFGKVELPDMLIVEIDDADTEIGEIEEQLIRLSKITTVFVTFAATNVDLIRKLIRIGVHDVIPQPIDQEDLKLQALKVLSDKRDRIITARGAFASVFSIIDAKGGSGASTISANVAATVHNLGSASVALIDFDLQLGISALILNVQAKANVNDALSQSHRIDPVFIKALMTKHPSGVDVLTSPGDLTSVTDISVEDVRRVIDGAAEAYDIVILHLPPLYTNWTVQALKMSEKILLIMQNTLAMIKDSKTILDTLPFQGVDRDAIEVVINRSDSNSGAVSVEDVKRTLNLKTIHEIRTDFKAAVSAQNQGMLISEVAPKSKLQHDIDSLSRYLYNSVSDLEPLAKTKSMFSFFGNKD